MKAGGLLTKPAEELRKDLLKLTARIAELSSDLRVKDVKNVRQIRVAKKDVARIKTVLRQQELKGGGAQ